MATITAHKRKKGTTWTAQIRIRRKGEIVYTESETFDKKALAKAWADRRESDLRQPGALERVRHRGVSVGQVLEWYRDDFDGRTKFGRTKLSHINYLINHPDFSALDALQLTSRQLVEHARQRAEGGAAPSTINNDFIWLSNAFRAVRIGRNMPLDQVVVEDAAFLCRREGIIGRPRERSRRPSIDELDRLLEHFNGRRRGEIPMVDVALFALFSARRQDEICRIRWDDLDDERRRVLVRDMKHPRKNIDTWCFLPDRAWDVIQRQPGSEDGRIFPYQAKSVSAAFTRACSLLGIEDLRFHDLRHEATSHLFELGEGIPQVASVTGHRSWQNLQRYTHLQERGVVDKYAGWSWLAGGG